MLQRFKRFSGIAIGLLVVLTVCGYALWRFELGLQARIPHGVCLPSDERAYCYNRATVISSYAPTALTVSADGRLLANAKQRLIQLWDVRTGKRLRSLWGHQDWVTTIAFSPNQQILASGSLDQTIRLWDITSGRLLQTIRSDRVTCLKFSPDGQWLVGGSHIQRWTDGKLSLPGLHRWAVSTGQALKPLGSEPVAALAFSPDGQLLAIGGTATQLWDFSHGYRLRTLNSGEVTSLAFSPDGQTLISGSSKTKFWHTQTGALQHEFKSGAADLAIAPDGQVLAVANGGTVNFWQLETNAFLGSLRGSLYSSLFITFGLNGQAFIGGSSDGIKVWRSTPPRSRHEWNPSTTEI